MDEATDEAINECAQPRMSLIRKASTAGCAMWTPIAFPARSLAPAILAAPAAPAEVSASGGEAPGAVAPSADDSSLACPRLSTQC
jgi:hypothetical protein